MSVESIVLAPRPAAPFAPQHRADRNFFLLLVILTWLGVAGGFGLDMIAHFKGTRPYPLIVHLHALLFVGWLVLLTTQVLLIRDRRADIHRRLGMTAAWMIPVMVVVALATAWTVQHQMALLLPARARPQFIGINITDMLGFATLAFAGIMRRRDSSAHKRLMLLSTLYLSTAGFARLWLLTIGTAGTDTFWGFFIAYNIGGDIVIALLGVYDLATRGRLHPAYVLGAGWVLANELAAAWLFFSPGWKAISIRLLGLGT
jgi:hypothetical protein